MYFRLSPLNQKDVVGFAMLTTVFIYSFLEAESIAKDCCGSHLGLWDQAEDIALLHLPYCIHNVTLTLAFVVYNCFELAAVILLVFWKQVTGIKCLG